MNVFNIENSFKRMKREKWSCIYWCIDFHHTVFPGLYNRKQKIEFYPGAKEVLKYLSSRDDVRLIGWTSSTATDCLNIWKKMYASGITFGYINQNPEVMNTKYADFDSKFYFNILLDDKAGFEGETDWLLIKKELIRIKKWKTH